MSDTPTIESRAYQLASLARFWLATWWIPFGGGMRKVIAQEGQDLLRDLDPYSAEHSSLRELALYSRWIDDDGWRDKEYRESLRRAARRVLFDTRTHA